MYFQSFGTSEHITMLCCVSAARIPHPPMIIYANSFPGGQYRFEGPDDVVHARSKSGWIDAELFMVWLNKLFLKYAFPSSQFSSSQMGISFISILISLTLP